ncbi:MAG: hypothetical protein FWF91_03245 [Coriobacteriia bacterium]|nr:hypothetical protein [Coriobacteriia bacterium]
MKPLEETELFNDLLSDPANLTKRFKGERDLVIRIKDRIDDYKMACEQKEGLGNSIIEAWSKGENKDLLDMIVHIDEIEAEIRMLEEKERVEYQQLKLLSDGLKTEHLRRIIEMHITKVSRGARFPSASIRKIPRDSARTVKLPAGKPWMP